MSVAERLDGLSPWQLSALASLYRAYTIDGNTMDEDRTLAAIYTLLGVLKAEELANLRDEIDHAVHRRLMGAVKSIQHVING